MRSTPRFVRWLRIMLTFIFISRFCYGQASISCPSAPGYTFYRLQEIPGAYVLTTLASLNNPNTLAAACNSQLRCTAFTPAGSLLTAPMVPNFSLLDGSSPETLPCDGVYVANDRTVTGLKLPEGVTLEGLRAGEAKRVRNMQAAAAAAKKVGNKMQERKINPRKAQKLSAAEIADLFAAAQTPLSQSSDALGTYSLADVMAALSYPEWDSRAVNGTSYSYITPVKDQGSCGSCVAFAATAAAESAIRANDNAVVNTIDLSEQWLFFCNGLYAPTCSAGWYGDAASNVITTVGLPYEVHYPYQYGVVDCTLKKSPEQRPRGKFTSFVYNDLTLAKEHIRQNGALMTYFAVYNDFYYWGPASKPYVWDGVSPLAGYHQVAVVGYSDTGAYWIAKNSWGSYWGESGYFRISYNSGAGFMSGEYDNIAGYKWTPPSPTRSPPSLSSPPSPPQSSSPPSRPPQPSSPPPPAPLCGDGLCGGNETCATCPGDCGACAVCGDSVCSGGETCSTCFQDCFILQSNGSKSCCGDNVWAMGAGESCSTCALDCGACPMCNNNGICEPSLGEKCTTGNKGCKDCGTCGASGGGFCGDGKCTSSRKGYSENCASCPTDCGVCDSGMFCGDGVCSTSPRNEKSSCDRDCRPWTLSKAKLGNSEANSGNGNNGNGNGNGNGNNGNGKGNGRRTRRVLA